MNSATKKLDSSKIRSEINGLKKSLLNLRFQKSSGQLEKTAQIRKDKKQIARLCTELTKIKGATNA